jgi:hypothetical protein
LLSSLGRLSLVFTLAILAPTNPQSYDPNVFLITCALACLAAILTFAAQTLVPPLSSNRRLELLLREARSDRRGPGVAYHRHLTSEEAAYHDATRVQQIAAASGADQSALNEAMRCFDRSIAVRRCSGELNVLKGGPLAEATGIAQAALARRDAGAILNAAAALHKAAARHNLSADPACAALVLSGVALSPSPAEAIGRRQS